MSVFVNKPGVDLQFSCQHLANATLLSLLDLAICQKFWEGGTSDRPVAHMQFELV
jgi:hypothetical protein